MGTGATGMWTSLLLGGRHRALAAHLGAHLRTAMPGYEVVDDLEQIPSELRGVHRAQPGEPPPPRRRAARAAAPHPLAHRPDVARPPRHPTRAPPGGPHRRPRRGGSIVAPQAGASINASQGLRRTMRQAPSRRRVALVAKPVVHPVGSALPELDLLGLQAVAAPVRRARHLLALEAGGRRRRTGLRARLGRRARSTGAMPRPPAGCPAAGWRSRPRSPVAPPARWGRAGGPGAAAAPS